LQWTFWTEPLPAGLPPHVVSSSPLEQLNITQDQTEYMFYTTTLDSLPSASILTIDGRCANSYSVFVNGALVANTFDDSHNMCSETFTVHLPAFGDTSIELSILSGSLGLNNGVNYAGRHL
jgi:hypothetical protein